MLINIRLIARNEAKSSTSMKFFCVFCTSHKEETVENTILFSISFYSSVSFNKKNCFVTSDL